MESLEVIKLALGELNPLLPLILGEFQGLILPKKEGNWGNSLVGRHSWIKTTKLKGRFLIRIRLEGRGLDLFKRTL